MRCLLAVALLAAAPLASGAERNLVEEFPIFKDGDAILVPLLLKGKPYIFLLDTGSKATLFDTSHKSELGEPSDTRERYGVTGPVACECFGSQVLHLGTRKVVTGG